MVKQKKIGVSISRQKVYKSYLYKARVTYNRKSTNFCLYDDVSIELSASKNLEENFDFLEKRVERAIRLLEIKSIKKPFNLIGIRSKYEFCYDNIAKFYGYYHLKLLRGELGDLLTYNEFISIKERIVDANEFRRSPGGLNVEEYEEGVDIFEKIETSTVKFGNSLLERFSVKSQKIVIIGFLLKEFISKHNVSSDIIDWYEKGLVIKFSKFYEKNFERKIKEFSIPKFKNSVFLFTEVLDDWIIELDKIVE